MAKKLKIYIDTSVVGGCLDGEFRETSVKLMDMFKAGKAIALLSDLLFLELEEAPAPVKQLLQDIPHENTVRLPVTDEMRHLQTLYVRGKVVGPSCGNDALHVAVATVEKADVIVSWNFKHIVHLDKILGFNAINVREGYGNLVILTPREVV